MYLSDGHTLKDIGAGGMDIFNTIFGGVLDIEKQKAAAAAEKERIKQQIAAGRATNISKTGGGALGTAKTIAMIIVPILIIGIVVLMVMRKKKK